MSRTEQIVAAVLTGTLYFSMMFSLLLWIVDKPVLARERSGDA